MNDPTNPDPLAESTGDSATAPEATFEEIPFTPGQANWLTRVIKEACRESMTAWQPPGIGGPPNAGGASPPMGAGPPLGTAPLNPNRPDTPNNDFIQGLKGQITFGTLSGSTYTFTNFPIEQISVDDDLETDDITNSSSGGGKIMLDNLQQMTGTITFIWDSLNIFLVAPLPFKPRTYAKLQVMPDGVSIIAFTALMSGFSLGTGPKAGSVRVACKYMSSGPITYPTANLTAPTASPTS